MGLLNAAGQIGQHQAEGRAVKGRNRAKLKNFSIANEQYKERVMLDNAEWKNDVQVQEVEQDQLYQAMVNQWTDQDKQLDKLFADADHKIEDAVIQAYESEYAGTQTGRTAGRLAAKSAKKLGQYKAETLSKLMFAQDEVALKKDAYRTEAEMKSRSAFEKIRFSPIHGHTPHAPELEAAPSKSGLILGLLKTGLTTAVSAGAFKAPDIGKGDEALIEAMKPGGAASGPSFAEGMNMDLGYTPLETPDWGIDFSGASAPASAAAFNTDAASGFGMNLSYDDFYGGK
jgi:predicted GIY-YIG superfamily endonuclease